MEDYEAQEIEFWAKLEEEGMSRSSMLRRSAAAAFGLTVLGSASTALGATRAGLGGPAARRRPRPVSPALVKAAKKEGHLNTIALPPDWANYGEMMSTFPKKYGIEDHERQPGRKLGAGEPGDRLAQGRLARAGRRRRRRPVRDRRREQGLYAKYFNSNYKTIPRALKDTRGFWMGDYWGAISIGYNKNAHQQPAEDVEGPD